MEVSSEVGLGSTYLTYLPYMGIPNITCLLRYFNWAMGNTELSYFALARPKDIGVSIWPPSPACGFDTLILLWDCTNELAKLSASVKSVIKASAGLWRVHYVKWTLWELRRRTACRSITSASTKYGIRIYLVLAIEEEIAFSVRRIWHDISTCLHHTSGILSTLTFFLKFLYNLLVSAVHALLEFKAHQHQFISRSTHQNRTRQHLFYTIDREIWIMQHFPQIMHPALLTVYITSHCQAKSFCSHLFFKLHCYRFSKPSNVGWQYINVLLCSWSSKWCDGQSEKYSTIYLDYRHN